MTRAVQNKLKDIANITWAFVGRPYSMRDNNHYYTSATVSCRDGTSRLFTLGDCVYVDAGDDSGNSWICQIVEMYSNGPPPDDSDDDFQVVHDSTASTRMRTVLRWLYHPNDIMEETRASMRPEFKVLDASELYFSDHLEFEGNALEVIDGRAFLFETVDEMKRFKRSVEDTDDTSETGYWAGDKLHVVRYYYGTQASNPPPVRELEKGELKFLLENPRTDPMYKRSRTIRRGGYEPVLKGTGKKTDAQKNTATKWVVLRRDTNTDAERKRDIVQSTPKSSPPKRSSESADGLKLPPAKRTSESVDGLKTPPSKRRSESVERPKHSGKRRSESVERPKSTKRRSSSLDPAERQGSRLRKKSAERSPKRHEIVEAAGGKEKKKRRDTGEGGIRQELQKRKMELEKRKAEIEQRKKEIGKKKKLDAEKRSQSQEHRKVAEQKIPAKVVADEEEAQVDVADETYGELVKSFEQLSVRQQKYCTRNLEAHVKLVVQKLNERGLDWSLSDANKMLIVQDVVLELLDDTNQNCRNEEPGVV